MNFQYQGFLTNYLSQYLNLKITIENIQPLYGGSINQVYRMRLGVKVQDSVTKTEQPPREIVVKVNTRRPPGFLKKELDGLKCLRKYIKSNKINIRIPQPIAILNPSSLQNVQLLIMEYIPHGNRDYGENVWEAFGQHLALLHRETGKLRTEEGRKYGWHENTYIGNNIQYNTLEDNWIDFFHKYRLSPQRDWGVKNKLLPSKTIAKLDLVIESLKKYLPSHPPSSLLHGDLWTGNFFFSNLGEPVIFDPAVYYGHGETDLALSELFGSFPPAFYSGYHSCIHRDSGTEIRKTIYNLYHLLNHLNLFGISYLPSVNYSIDTILKHNFKL